MKKIDFDKLFDNNILVRVSSLIIAIVVWFTIIITSNPDQKKTIDNISVTIPISDSTAGNMGLEVVTGGSQKVKVSLNGKRYKVGNLTAKDIIVKADVSKIKSAGTYNLKLTASQKKSDDDYDFVSISPSTIKVRFDYVVSADYTVEAEAPNVTAKDNFIKENAYPSTEKITLKGAQSDIERVKRAVLISDKKVSISKTLIIDNPKLILLDKENKEVDQSAITYSPDNLQITVPILKQKIFNLTFGYKNIPDDFPIDELNYTMSKSTLKVMAASEAIGNVKELNIGYIDLRTVDIGSKFVLEIGLPSGFVNLENTKKVTVKFEKSGFSTKTFNIETFAIKNKPEDYDVSVATKILSNVKIVGKRSIVETLKAKEILASIDLKTDVQITQAGQINAPIKLSVPGKGLVWAVGEYSAVLNAVKK